MNWKKIFAIARKDIKEATQNKSVWLPILIVPLIFVVVMPLMMILIFKNPELSKSMNNTDVQQLMSVLPEFMKLQVAGLNEVQTMIVLMLGYFFAPFFLILPLMFSTTIAAESFAGERERKTIEALLYTPVSDAEMFIGKALASLIPAVTISWASFLGYIVVLNAGAYSVIGHIWFPLTNWYPLIFWVSPAISLLGIAITVLISAKVQTFMGAYQTSASLVVLILGVLAGQATGVLALSVTVGLIMGAVLWLIDAVLLYFAIRSFNRYQLLQTSAA
jgi:ABC-type Na+ efflux pump permease subunit